jgi:HAMP domain-containing protein
MEGMSAEGRRLLEAAQRSVAAELDRRVGAPLSTSELNRLAATVRKLRTHVHGQRRSA